MQSSYLDFELEIGVGQGRDYPVAVLRSPAGEARATMRLPFDEIQLESRLKDLQIALLRSGGTRRRVSSKEERAVLDFGRALFDALLVGETRSLYDVSLSRAEQAGLGLRLKLRIASAPLAALPWEFLYDSRRAEFVCLSVHTPVVRYLELPNPPRPLLTAPPLRILGMIASPSDVPGLDVDNERQRVELALAGLREQGLVVLEWLLSQTWRDLQRAMRRGPWHIFHFVGHGAFDANADEGLILLCDDQGKAQRFRATELGRMLADHRTLRLAVLNACEGARGSDRDIFSSTASILVQRGIPAVLAMQYEITDRAAVELSRAFYEALADGLPVDAAVAEARKAVSWAVANTVEWGTPVLYMRAPDGMLFEFSATPSPARPAPRQQEPPVKPAPATTAHPTLAPTSGIENQCNVSAEGFLDSLARDTWAYLHSDQATANHLPYSWWSASLPGGDYAITTEIGLYALSWLAAYDLGRPWSPSWPATEAELHAILDQLRAWQTGSQAYQPHGPNAYQNSVFYQWYWISWTPPVVGANVGLNQLVPSVDNAWLAASLITIRAYALANNHPSLAQKADAILQDMDFRLWYDDATHLFYWGDIQNPQGGGAYDCYSAESRIINFVARALGQLSREEFLLSLDALEQSAATYDDITVEKVSWNGAYFLYTSPALFIREMDTSYGANTITPATQAQIAYARDRGYPVWGFSDCNDVGDGGYVNQGAPPVAMPDPPETRPGLVAPYASGLALITPLADEALANLQAIAALFDCAYDPSYGFRDSVMANPSAPDYGQCSNRFSALAQEWIFLAIVNYENDFMGRYFYRDPGVMRAHVEM